MLPWIQGGDSTFVLGITRYICISAYVHGLATYGLLRADT